MRYRFGDIELDLDTFELRAHDQRVPVEPQVFEVIAYLVMHRDRLVPRHEILDAVWGDRFVSDGALSSRVAAARAALGDDGRSQKYIRTVHGRGLQFVAPVEQLSSGQIPDLVTDPSDLHQKVRFVAADDDLRLAVATVGQGRTLVRTATWLTHVENDWRSPVWRHHLVELGNRFQFVRYDPRGCGLSDWDISSSDLTDLGRWVADLEVVVDSLDVDQVALLGTSQGGPPAIAYAVEHPERVSHLVLFGTYAQGMVRRGTAGRDESEALLALMKASWGGTNPAFRSVFTMTFMPHATSDQVRWFNELQTLTTNAENAIRLESALYDVDITALAPQVSVPTLIMHGRDDRAVPYDQGRLLARLIPGAEFVSLDSSNHILRDDEPAFAEYLANLERFLAG